MNKHSRGPWIASKKLMTYIVHGEGSNPFSVTCIHGADGGAVASCEWDQVAADTLQANIRLITKAPDLWDIVAKFGDGIADLFEQLERGNWIDDHGHDVRNNAAMLQLQSVMREAMELRAKVADGDLPNDQAQASR